MAMPDRKILVQKPKELRNLSAKAVAALDKLPEEAWVYQPKFDGCSVIVLVGVNVVRIFSREGKECLSMPHIAEHIRRHSHPNMVYFGEAYHPDKEFPEISGMFRRQSPQAELQFFAFDAVTLQEFRAGKADRPYDHRVKALRGISDKDAGVIPVGLYKSVEACQDWIDAAREYGYKLSLDGMMKKQAAGVWEAGDDREGRSLKLKDHISVDLKVLDVEEGQGKFTGMVGRMIVEWRGKPVPISGGKMTNADRIFYFCEGFGRIKDSIVEVHALGLTPDGQLREPRFQRIRDDKTEPSE
jgi:DNA ligase-1